MIRAFLASSILLIILGAACAGWVARGEKVCPPTILTLPAVKIDGIGRCQPGALVQGPNRKVYRDFSCDGGAHLLLPLSFQGA